jgi:hypothetical protein
MAIVKATYTKLPTAMKASLAYYTTRPTLEGKRGARAIFGKEGMLTKKEVDAIINK